MITLEEARENIGRGVVYDDGGMHGDCAEDGVITSVNESYVFVRYSRQHPGANGQATSPRMLDWLQS